MPYTNIHNIPEPLATALATNTHDKGDAHISVTSLWKSPQMVHLTAQHEHEIFIDIDNLVPSFIGTAVHKYIESLDRSRVKEIRLFSTIEGITFSGQFDRYEMDGAIIQDYKVTSAKSFMYERHRSDWENQLNSYAYLLREHGEIPKALWAIVILKDWSRFEAERNLDYPQKHIHIVELPIWSHETAYERLRERVLQHKNPISHCTPEDMWMRPGKYAVVKPGRQKAVRLFDHEADATAFISTQSDKGKLHVEVRPPIYLRCDEYCGAAPFCPQKAARQNPHVATDLPEDL